MGTVPNVWSTTVYAVSWFSQSNCDIPLAKISDEEPAKPRPTTGGFRDSWGRFWASPRRDVEAGSDADRQSTRAPWSKGLATRRGIDVPFAKMGDAAISNRTSPTGSTLLRPPPEAHPKDGGPSQREGSRYVELFRESVLPPIPSSQSDTLSYYGLHLDPRPDSPFPLRVDDHDLPIPLPRLSEWIRADTAKGINVHTVPPISP